MKRNRPIYLFNSDDPSKFRQQESSEQSTQNKTGYIKAIQPGQVNMPASKNDTPTLNPDRLAALRYIKESAFLKKFYFGKMSC